MKRFIALLLALCILSVNAAFLISCGDNLPTEEPPNNNEQTENTPSDKTEPTITIPEYKDYQRGTINFDEIVYKRPDI